jgi:hypothetical protein
VSGSEQLCLFPVRLPSLYYLIRKRRSRIRNKVAGATRNKGGVGEKYKSRFSACKAQDTNNLLRAKNAPIDWCKNTPINWCIFAPIELETFV